VIERQHQVLKLASHGLSGRQTGQRLGISYSTVRHHRAQAIKAMGSGSLIQAVVLADRSGYFGEPDRPLTTIQRLYLRAFEEGIRLPSGPSAHPFLEGLSSALRYEAGLKPKNTGRGRIRRPLDRLFHLFA
jgi:DNA-binding CsgD family transcriptional regulator